MRQFMDRLISHDEKDLFVQIVQKLCKSTAGLDIKTIMDTQSFIWTDSVPITIESLNKKETKFIYREIANMDILRDFMVKALDEFNDNS
jgi:hypothetical protein